MTVSEGRRMHTKSLRRIINLLRERPNINIQNIQIYSTVIAKTQIGAQGENPEQRFQDGYHMVKFETRGQNLRNFLRPHTNSLKLVITIDQNQFVPFSESSELKSPIFVEK